MIIACINISGAEDIVLLMLFNADNSLAAKFEFKKRDWEDWNKLMRKINKILSNSVFMIWHDNDGDKNDEIGPDQ